jgi:hypothetical protein
VDSGLCTTLMPDIVQKPDDHRGTLGEVLLAFLIYKTKSGESGGVSPGVLTYDEESAGLTPPGSLEQFVLRDFLCNIAIVESVIESRTGS